VSDRKASRGLKSEVGGQRSEVGNDEAPATLLDGVAANDELTFVLANIIVIESQEKGQKFATLKR